MRLNDDCEMELEIVLDSHPPYIRISNKDDKNISAYFPLNDSSKQMLYSLIAESYKRTEDILNRDVYLVSIEDMSTILEAIKYCVIGMCKQKDNTVLAIRKLNELCNKYRLTEKEEVTNENRT